MKIYSYLKFGLMAGGATSGIVGYYQRNSIEEKVASFQEKIERNSEVPLLKLGHKESASFPWEFNPNDIEEEDWEFRKVEILGSGAQTRHLVKKDKGDREGFLVFTGLATAEHISGESRVTLASEEEAETSAGIIVCLGWVPKEKAMEGADPDLMDKYSVSVEEENTGKEIIESVYRDTMGGFKFKLNKQGENPTSVEQLVDPEEATKNELKAARYLLHRLNPTTDHPDDNPDTEASLYSPIDELFEGEDAVKGYTGYHRVSGFLRKGEDEDKMKGRTNKGPTRVSKVDLLPMANYYKYKNISAYEYYLDLATDDDEVYNTTLPQPLHFDRPLERTEELEKNNYYTGYDKLMKYGGVLAAIGLIL